MTAELPRQNPCHIIIIGASGDLAQRKLLPALFSLYCSNLLPKPFSVWGFARTQMDDAAFREMAVRNLTCRYEPEADKCEQRMEEFLNCCFYHPGNYDDPEAFTGLRQRMMQQAWPGNVLAYMSIPPSVYEAAAASLGAAGLAEGEAPCWARAVIEKPFGRDSASSRVLSRNLAKTYPETSIYRIDHYLGKEVIQNLMILRFANLIFEPIWNRQYIDRVTISWGEKIGCEGRAGYFDQYGIIRDVVQNHLLQILALVTMEQPIGLEARRIAEEKVKVLRCIPPVRLDHLLVGQYAGYREESGVPAESRTETYARAVLAVNNPRWYGVPFLIEAGKALNDKRTEIEIRFRDVPYSVFRRDVGMQCNRLVIRVQPNEAIELHVVNKRPGLDFALESADLNLLYHTKFKTVLPEAYERLLLDVVRGDQSLFLGDEELDVCWDIVTPALHELEEKQVEPLPYPFGSNGPASP